MSFRNHRKATAWPITALLILAWSAGALAQSGTPATAKPSSKSDRPAPTLADYDVSNLKLGGDFTLTNQDGKRASLKKYRGKVALLFFGYTYCPDVCPVTMSKVVRMRGGLGSLGQKVQNVFITIDPERDTPARLKAYLANQDPAGVAFTGSHAEIQAAAALYRVRYDKEEGKATDAYLMAHTAYLYLVDRQGKLRYVFPPDVDDALLASGVKTLLGK